MPHSKIDAIFLLFNVVVRDILLSLRNSVHKCIYSVFQINALVKKYQHIYLRSLIHSSYRNDPPIFFKPTCSTISFTRIDSQRFKSSLPIFK
jgi:hypothetical protein